MSTARCARHPDRPSRLTCARCGDFACADCISAENASCCTRCALRPARRDPWAVRRNGLSFMAGGAAIVVGTCWLMHGAEWVYGSLLAFLWGGYALILAGAVQLARGRTLTDSGLHPLLGLLVALGLMSFAGLATWLSYVILTFR